MLTVGLKACRFRALHGYHQEESVLGGEFEIDISCTLQTSIGSISDELDNTLNYGALHRLCGEIMGQRVNLLEELADRIAQAVWDRYAAQISSLHLEIRKLHPPLGATVGAAFVRLEQDAAPA